ncbi:HAMP domain-containing sensor histidine kinase [Streptomyces sp. NPDC046465]|uniref:sensor histidine kinase n=1 Tax=Streptomyces sp. NPDC046465 TaxID=3155810 RepID=UPI0033C9DF0C
MARDIPLRKSLLARLLAVSVLVSIGSIAATAWLAAQTTSGALRQEQGQVLADDARIYDRLLGVGASAPEWRGADKAVRELARSTGRRIALTTQDRKIIADSAAPKGQGPSTAGSSADAPSEGGSKKDGPGKKSTGTGNESTGKEDLGKEDPGKEDPSKEGSVKDDSRRTSLPPTASAVLDPLAVDSTLSPGRTDEDTNANTNANTNAKDATADRIDPRAVGPYRLTTAERDRLKAAADKSAGCLADLGAGVQVVVGPGGRPTVQVSHDPDEFLKYRCRMPPLEMPTETEQKALKKLNSLAEACMKRHGLGPVMVGLDLTGRTGPKPVTAAVPSTPPVTPDVDPERAEAELGPAGAADSSAVDPAAAARAAATASCVDTARREQLGPYVSSPALLFITSSDGTRSTPGFSLSRGNTVRLAGLAAAVLAVTVAVTAFAATRLTRPLRALTTATRRMKAGETSEPVPARVTRSAGEISQLAAAFNDMAAHRKALEEQRKAMVSDVAHELRTPLSNIRGWLEAAEDGVVDTDPELVTSLLEEALLLQHVVDDLQDLAAADAGTLRLHREAVRAAEIADQVAAAHQARADAAGVRLRATVFGDPWVRADPLRLRQAIGNLVSNAVRHTPEGGSVRISCRTADDAVLIEVADTGTGIAAADLPHVFDRFWRADKSRTRATGGSGLGLSIVRKLVEAHDGSVTAESVPGKGSMFTVRLPVA